MSLPSLKNTSDRTYMGVALLSCIFLYAGLAFAGKDLPRLLDLAYVLGGGLAGVSLPRRNLGGSSVSSGSGSGGASVAVATADVSSDDDDGEAGDETTVTTTGKADGQ